MEDQYLVKNDHIVLVVVKHITEWEPLGRILGLSESIIIEIRNNNPQNYREQKYQCIMKWMSEHGQDAKLITLLRKIYFDLENKSLVMNVVEGKYVYIKCMHVTLTYLRSIKGAHEVTYLIPGLQLRYTLGKWWTSNVHNTLI